MTNNWVKGLPPALSEKEKSYFGLLNVIMKLVKTGLIKIERHPQMKYVIKVDWGFYNRLFPNGNKEVERFLKKIENRNPFEVEAQYVSWGPPRVLKTITKKHTIYKNPKYLRELEMLGFITLDYENGVVRVPDNVSEIIDDRVFADYYTRKYLKKMLLSLKDQPLVKAELSVRTRWHIIEGYLNNIKDLKHPFDDGTREAKAIKTEEKEQDSIPIDILPPKKYPLNAFPSFARPWVVLFFLGKAAEEGRIDPQEVREIVERGDAKRLFKLLEPHVVEFSKTPRKTVERILRFLSLVIKRVDDLRDHDNIIAHTFMRCPLCGEKLKRSASGLVCESCNIVYEEPKTEPPLMKEIFNSPPTIHESDLVAQRWYPNIFPVLVVKHGDEHAIVINTHHPLIRVLKGYGRPE